MKTTTARKKKVKSSRIKPGPRAKATVRRRRPIHKKVLLHPITIFFLLCVGVFIVGSTIRALASDIAVTAKVAAPALADGALILSPVDGAVFTQETVSVTGTCPVNSYVTVERNAIFAGVGFCDGTGAYAVSISLFPGANVLSAQAYNLTDDAGPVTPDVSVIYTVPETIPPGPISVPEIPEQGSDDHVDISSVDTPGDLPVILSSYGYRPVTADSVFSWDIYLAGGRAPYTLYVNWGDGQESTIKEDKAEKVTMRHSYKKQGYYNIKIKMVDAKNKVSVLQLVAVVQSPVTPSAINNIINSPGSKSFFSEGWALLVKNWLAVAWGSYITVTLMAVSFWLGERQELSELALRRRNRSHKV